MDTLTVTIKKHDNDTKIVTAGGCEGLLRFMTEGRYVGHYLASYKNPKKRGFIQYETLGYQLDEQDAIQALVEKFDKVLEKKKRRLDKTQRKNARIKELGNPYKVGQLLYDSWGYEQTNIDFYEVVKVTDFTVKVEKIGGFSEDTGYMQGKCWPNPEQRTGEFKTYRLSLWQYDDRESLAISLSDYKEGDKLRWSSYC